MVGPGTVADTTTSPAWTPARVTIALSDPIVGVPRDPLHLDGPLSWAAYLEATHAGVDLPPIGRDWIHDFALPLATWTGPCTRPDPDPRLLAADGVNVWGWACSAANYSVTRHTVAHVRRKPALEEMARWCTDRRHHISNGPRRAANITKQAAWVDRVVWWCLADVPLLQSMLGRLTHLGQQARHGWGRIHTVTVEEDQTAWEAWRLRDMPDPGGTPGGSIRAPYWHQSRRMLCSSTRRA